MSEKIHSEIVSRRGDILVGIESRCGEPCSTGCCWCWRPQKKPKHKPKASNAATRDKVGGRIGVISAAIKDKARGVVERTADR